MPRIKVYQKTEPEGPVVRLKLGQGDGCVDLVAVDEDGNRVDRGYIATIYESGRMVKRGSVDPGLGFQLDGDGRVKD